jgi:hypothetical protein
MLSFVPDGRECFAIGDERGAVLVIGVVEPERTARRRLVVSNFITVDFPAVNFCRHERRHRDDGTLGGFVT